MRGQSGRGGAGNTAPVKAKARPGGSVGDYWHETASPLGSAALTMPLLALHGLGAILAPEVRNGADLVSVALATSFHAAGLHGTLPWALFYGVVVLLQASLVLWLASRGRLATRWMLPFFVECASYAVLFGIVSGLITHHLLDALRAAPVALTALAWSDIAATIPATATAAARTTAASVTALDAILISFGAGFHEELVFRLGGIALVARKLAGESWRRRPGVVAALLLVSSLLFSAAHHLVEPFALNAFIFRTAMGGLFGALFLSRGFAAVAWTHALYDIWVLLVAN